MVNMFRCLENVRMGVVDPVTFKSSECRKRSCNLKLSAFRDVENVHSSGVNTLDADNESGSYLLSGCVDGSIYMHDLRNFSGSPCYTSKTVHKIDKNNIHSHKYSVETVQWYPFDTGLFTTSGMDKVLKIWDSSTMKPAESIKFKGRIFQHHISPHLMETSCLIAVSTTINQLLLSDLRTGCNAHELRGHTSSVLCCRWSPQEYILASGSADNRIILWDVRSPKSCLKMLDQHNGKGRSASEQLHTAHDGFVNGLCFTRNGRNLMSFGTDCRLRLWNGLTGENEMVNYGTITNDTKKSVQIDVSANANGDFVYVPSEGNVFILDIDTGNKVKVLRGHYNTVNCCYYHHFNIQLYTGGNDRNVLCWSDEYTQLDVFEEVKSSSCNSRSTIVTADTWSSDDEQSY